MNPLSNFFREGRMISGSKSGYCEAHPTHRVAFNANIFTSAGKKIWYGDLDLTLDRPKLEELATALNDALYVLSEMDGRFDNEAHPKLDRAICAIIPKVTP